MGRILNGVGAMWKQAAMTLGTVVVAMLAFWFVEGREYQTHAQVKETVADQVALLAAPHEHDHAWPWLADRELVMRTLTQSTEALKNNTQAIQDLRVVVAELSVEVRHLREERRNGD